MRRRNYQNPVKHFDFPPDILRFSTFDSVAAHGGPSEFKWLAYFNGMAVGRHFCRSVKLKLRHRSPDSHKIKAIKILYFALIGDKTEEISHMTDGKKANATLVTLTSLLANHNATQNVDFRLLFQRMPQMCLGETVK